MDDRERVTLIRAGNELFNKGEIEKAVRIFEKTSYKDGLARVGDYYFYEKKMPLMAFGYYKKADMKNKINEIYERMIYALGKWIRDEKPGVEKNPPQEDVKIKISPKLKILAEEILRDAETLQK